jgi:hypothetical protein
VHIKAPRGSAVFFSGQMQHRGVFGTDPSAPRQVIAAHYISSAYKEWPHVVRKDDRSFWLVFVYIYQNDIMFHQDRLGTNTGETHPTKKRDRFLAAVGACRI